MTNEEFIKKISLQGEKWKDVPEFEGLYKCSNMGRVIALQKSWISGRGGLKVCEPKLIKLKPGFSNNSKYYRVRFNKFDKYKHYSVHRLVATLFVPNPDNLPQVEHLDCNPQNNRSSNLKWNTNIGNMHNPLTIKKISKNRKGVPIHPMRKPVVQLFCGKLIRRYDLIMAVKEYGFDNSAVSKVCNGKMYHTGGFELMYEKDYLNLINKSKNESIPMSNSNQ